MEVHISWTAGAKIIKQAKKRQVRGINMHTLLEAFLKHCKNRKTDLKKIFVDDYVVFTVKMLQKYQCFNAKGYKETQAVTLVT